MNGIAFEKIEIHFTYSFLWRFHSFTEFVNNLPAIKGKTECSIPNTYTNCPHIYKDIKYIYENWTWPVRKKLEDNTFIWSIGTHPDRLGLSPLLHFDTPETQKNSRDMTEVACYFRKRGPIEIRSGVLGTDFENPSDALVLQLDCWEALIRIADNGEGTFSFKFVLESEKCTRIDWDKQKTITQKRLQQKLGFMPFIFAALTLGRTEHNFRYSQAPASQLRQYNISNLDQADQADQANFESLYEVFHKILYHTVLNKLDPSFMNRSANHKNEEEISSLDCISGIESMDLHLASTEVNPEEYHPEMWQSPYVSMFATLNKQSTLVSNDEGQAYPWWLEGLENPRQCDKELRSQNSSYIINLFQCYKESVLLLLRLYQWRDFLGVNCFLNSSSEQSNHINLNNVPIPPDLLQSSINGNLFSDVDLVWDTRYLMLYHERSTLVFSIVKNNNEISTSVSSSSFKTLFRQSLLRSLEAIRAKWHAVLVLSIVLDSIIDELSNADSSADPVLLARISELRCLYAKLLRDPLAIATDAAALAEVRRRAENTYEIPRLMNSLGEKFSAITALINNQSVVRNLRFLKNDENSGIHK